MNDEELMKNCIELTRQGIDIEKVYKSLEPLFNMCKEITELAVKNYKFLKRGKHE